MVRFREKKESPYQKMYLVTPLIYEKLKKCISNSEVCDMDKLNKKHVPEKKDKSDSLIQKMAVKEIQPSFNKFTNRFYEVDKNGKNEKNILPRKSENSSLNKKWNINTTPEYRYNDQNENLNLDFDTEGKYYDDDEFDMDMDIESVKDNERKVADISKFEDSYENENEDYKIPDTRFRTENYQLTQPILDEFSDDSDYDINEKIVHKETQTDLEPQPQPSTSGFISQPRNSPKVNKNLKLVKSKPKFKKRKISLNIKPKLNKKLSSRNIGIQTEDIPEIITPSTSTRDVSDKYIQTDRIDRYYRDKPKLKFKPKRKKSTELIVKQPRDLIKKKQIIQKIRPLRSSASTSNNVKARRGPIITELDEIEDVNMQPIENIREGEDLKAITHEIKKIKPVTFQDDSEKIKRIENTWKNFIGDSKTPKSILKKTLQPTVRITELDDNSDIEADNILKAITNDANEIKAITYEGLKNSKDKIKSLGDIKRIENRWQPFVTAKPGKKGVLKFSCDVCNKGFSTKLGLNRHMKSFHIEEQAPALTYEPEPQSSNFEPNLGVEERSLDVYQPSTSMASNVNDELYDKNQDEMHHSDLVLATKRSMKSQLPRPTKYWKTQKNDKNVIDKNKEKKDIVTWKNFK